MVQLRRENRSNRGPVRSVDCELSHSKCAYPGGGRIAGELGANESNLQSFSHSQSHSKCASYVSV